MAQTYKQKAINTLRWIRRLHGGNYCSEGTLSLLRYRLNKGGLTLEDIGTNEEELEKLRVEYHKFNAERLLSALRNCTHPVMNPNKLSLYELGRLVQDELKEGGLTLEDIGINEEELAWLAWPEKVYSIRSKKVNPLS